MYYSKNSLSFNISKPPADDTDQKCLPPHPPFLLDFHPPVNLIANICLVSIFTINMDKNQTRKPLCLWASAMFDTAVFAGLDSAKKGSLATLGDHWRHAWKCLKMAKMKKKRSWDKLLFISYCFPQLLIWGKQCAAVTSYRRVLHSRHRSWCTTWRSLWLTTEREEQNKSSSASMMTWEHFSSASIKRMWLIR